MARIFVCRKQVFQKNTMDPVRFVLNSKLSLDLITRRKYSHEPNDVIILIIFHVCVHN